MLVAERREAILKLVHKEGSVYVPDLSQRFHVSPSTIRRDLEWLAERDRIRRTYGGAVAAEGVSQPPPQTDDVAQHIAAATIDLIAPGETIFIGPGPLCQSVAQHLCQRTQITVLTNALDVAWTLYQGANNLPLIVTGGPVAHSNGALAGQLTLQALETLRADRLIIEVAGVSPLEGLTCDELAQAEIVRALFQKVPLVVVLTTAERLGRVGAAWLGPASQADVIITGRDASSAIAWDLSEIGVKVSLV